MFWFVVLLLVVGAGFYFYQKMMAIEREIRAEQEAEQAVAKITESDEAGGTEAEAAVPPIVTLEVEKKVVSAEPVADEPLSLEEEVLVAVKNMPGIKQIELYSSFVDVNKKQLQKTLKELDDTGKVRREKQGSSYQLFPV